MKKQWLILSARFDALTLRERGMLFAMLASAVIFLVFYLFLNPHYARQKSMLQSLRQQQDIITGVEAEITQTIIAHQADPDAAERARLAQLQAEATRLKGALMAMQQGMVPAERMTGLLEQMLRGQRNLRLTSMRTLAPAEVDAAPTAPAAAPANATSAPKPPQQMLHRHGVELVVEGSYADLVAYMTALESMQGQLFWGSATLASEKYPVTTLRLVVYTVNLDKKWLTL